MSDLYGRLFREVLYPAYETGLRRRSTLARLRWLERTQWCSPGELEELQRHALRRLLLHAFENVPYYRRCFQQLGIAPSDIHDVSELRRLPLLTRSLAREQFAARKSRAAPLPSIDKSTSGTSGAPLVFAYDFESEYWRQAVKLRGYAWAGLQPGDRSLNFWGSPAVRRPPLARRAKQSLDHFVRRETFVDCTDRSEARLEQVLQLIRRLKPRALVCYAQAGVALARYVNAGGLRDWPDLPVITAAERLFENDRRELERAFGPGVFETYGSREVMLIAAECEAHQGMHLSLENLIVELVVRDERGERPAREGELGEVVITDLHNFGAPFIRYLTGDQAVRHTRERCPCGRGLPRLLRTEGRRTDTLRDGQGRPVSGLFFNVLFTALADRVRDFQVVQRRGGTVELKLVPTPRFEPALCEELQRHCARHLPGVELQIEIVPQLEAGPGGKLRVVKVES